MKFFPALRLELLIYAGFLLGDQTFYCDRKDDCDSHGFSHATQMSWLMLLLLLQSSPSLSSLSLMIIKIIVMMMMGSTIFLLTLASFVAELSCAERVHLITTRRQFHWLGEANAEHTRHTRGYSIRDWLNSEVLRRQIRRKLPPCVPRSSPSWFSALSTLWCL